MYILKNVQVDYIKTSNLYINFISYLYMIIIILFIILFIDYVFRRQKEKFSPSRIECPTRNMSYDLRGEAHFPPRTNFPFDNSEIGPYF
jgi:purine-cytosine permease-like protein